MHEFDVIQNFCSFQTVIRDDVVIGSGDDCAIVNIPSDQQLAITTDTLVAGVHFPFNTSAFDIGHKCLAVNLSDLAAMGASPAWVTFALTLPEVDKNWLDDLAKGFFALATRYQVQLIGGDLTRGHLTITLQAQGLLPKGMALTRSNAKPGDLIYVTHTLGDAGLALQFLKNDCDIKPEYQQALLTRLNRPEPRIEVGEKILSIANAAIDISDGLAADLKHILKKSGVGAIINVDLLPLSTELRASTTFENAIALALNAGDDYELCFTVSKEKEHLLMTAMQDCPCKITHIGHITDKQGLELQFNDGEKYHGQASGYQHF